MGSMTVPAAGSIKSSEKLPTTRTSVPVKVRGQHVLTLEISPTDGTVAGNGRVSYRVTVRNRGNGPARDVIVAGEVNESLRILRGESSSGTTVTFPRIDELPAGDSRSFTIEADAVAVGDGRMSVTVQARDLQNPLKDEQATRVTKR